VLRQEVPRAAATANLMSGAPTRPTIGVY